MTIAPQQESLPDQYEAAYIILAFFLLQFLFPLLKGLKHTTDLQTYTTVQYLKLPNLATIL